MDTNSAFRSLTAGIRFNRKKLPKQAKEAFQVSEAERGRERERASLETEQSVDVGWDGM